LAESKALGASSIITALSIAGLPTDGFVYDGFLPAKSAARQKALRGYSQEPRTVVLLESSHRIEACLNDIVDVLGPARQMVIARELTKRFETVLDGRADDVLAQVNTDPDQRKGEFVLMLAGVRLSSDSSSDAVEVNVTEMLRVMLADLPVKQAAGIVAKLSGLRKNDIYEQALAIKKQQNV